MTYDLRPMLATPSNGTRGRRGIDMATLVDTHAFDEKLDGVRALMVVEDGVIRLTNRNGVDRTAQYPDINPCGMLMDCVLDGEIVAVHAPEVKFSFEATAIRDKQSVATQHMLTTYPAHYVAFDVLYVDGNDVRSAPWHQRRTLMERLTAQCQNEYAVHIQQSVVFYPPNGMNLYTNIVADGGEGVIAKDVNGRYRPGRHPTWTKFKHTQSITCVAIGYEPGTGARKHFGAMKLALIDGRNVVEVGRVGTGFTDKEITALKSLLDSSIPFVVEIECLNVTKSGQLRFPVYKGLRTDLSVVDATLDQLDTIPTC